MLDKMEIIGIDPMMNSSKQAGIRWHGTVNRLFLLAKRSEGTVACFRIPWAEEAVSCSFTVVVLLPKEWPGMWSFEFWHFLLTAMHLWNVPMYLFSKTSFAMLLTCVLITGGGLLCICTFKLFTRLKCTVLQV